MPKFSLTLAVTRSLVDSARNLRKARERFDEYGTGGVKKHRHWYNYKLSVAGSAFGAAIDAYVSHFLVDDECEPIEVGFSSRASREDLYSRAPRIGMRLHLPKYRGENNFSFERNNIFLFDMLEQLTTTRMSLTQDADSLEDTILSYDGSWFRFQPYAFDCPDVLKGLSYEVPSPLVWWVLSDCTAVLMALFGRGSLARRLPVDVKKTVFLMVRGPLMA